jgi:MATE family multidrug resistance protein
MALLWWSAPVLGWFAVDAQIQPITIGYLQAFTWSLPAYLLVLAARFFAEGLGHGRTVFMVSMLALPLNVLANYALMYGAWGFPRLGAIGTGYATSIVWSVMALVLWVIFLRRKSYQCYQIKRWQLPDTKVIWSLVKIGFPIGIAVSMEVCMFALIGLFIGGLGMAAVAANQIAMNITSMIFMVPLGISNAITARVGQAVGQKSTNVRQVAYIGIALCVLFILPLSASLLLAAEYWVTLYTDVPQIQLLAIQLLWIAVLYQVFDALQLGTNGALRGLKDTRVPMFYTLIAYWCIGMPLGWWLSFPQGQGAAGFWYGIVVAFFCAAILQQIRLAQKIMRNHH